MVARAYFFTTMTIPGRRSITLALRSEEAERKAKELARAEQDKLEAAN